MLIRNDIEEFSYQVIIMERNAKNNLKLWRKYVTVVSYKVEFLEKISICIQGGALWITVFRSLDC